MPGTRPAHRRPGPPHTAPNASPPPPPAAQPLSLLACPPDTRVSWRVASFPFPTQPGVLVEPLNRGLRWRVYWRGGGAGVYATGLSDKFELEHLRVSVDQFTCMYCIA